jgi:hypothetical protein
MLVLKHRDADKLHSRTMRVTVTAHNEGGKQCLASADPESQGWADGAVDPPYVACVLREGTYCCSRRRGMLAAVAPLPIPVGPLAAADPEHVAASTRTAITTTLERSWRSRLAGRPT